MTWFKTPKGIVPLNPLFASTRLCAFPNQQVRYISNPLFRTVFTRLTAVLNHFNQTPERLSNSNCVNTAVS